MRLAQRILLAWLVVWLYGRPFRTVLWAIFAMALGFAAKHLFDLDTTSLEAVIAASNGLSVWLGMRALCDSYGDYHHQIKTNGNGMTEVADEEVGQDAMRVCGSVTLLVVSGFLLAEPPNGSYEALLAKHGILFASWYLLAAIVRERLSRRVLAQRARASHV